MSDLDSLSDHNPDQSPDQNPIRSKSKVHILLCLPPHLSHEPLHTFYFIFLGIIALFEKLTSKSLSCILKSHNEHPPKKTYTFSIGIKTKKMGLMTAPNDIS